MQDTFLVVSEYFLDVGLPENLIHSKLKGSTGIKPVKQLQSGKSQTHGAQ